MTVKERDAAYHTLITCDGEGKEAKAKVLYQLIEAVLNDRVEQEAMDAYYNRHRE